MAQREMGDAARPVGIGVVAVLAAAVAIGCGGSSAAGGDGAEGADDQGGGASPESIGITLPGPAPSGVDPAPSGVNPTAPAGLPVNDGAGGEPDPTPPVDPIDADPVQLTSETVTVTSANSELQATLFLARSPLGTRLELVEAGERICVRGELAAVPDNDFANYWGGEVGLMLTSSPATDMASPGDGLATPGFGFRLEGELPEQVRLRVAAAGEVPLFSQYCRDVADGVGTSIEVALDSLTQECWLNGGAPYPAAASATLVSWQLPANPGSSRGFDFCIEDIHALP
ncbi:MAG TPA: hypothetical protein VMG12_34605 [Polyangiaceae bacterium]|nr:hypothetical protein [Polyangiaceae bacterium]